MSIHSKAFAAALLAALLACPAAAMTEGRTAQGEAWISGGIGSSELELLDKQRGDFSLRILTAAKGSGAYLADALVKVTDAAGRTVLETRADGPWLYVNLRQGDYRVLVTYKSESRQQATRIHANDRHEMFFYFDEAVERLPKGEKG
jgi:hypothetical protein